MRCIYYKCQKEAITVWGGNALCEDHFENRLRLLKENIEENTRRLAKTIEYAKLRQEIINERRGE